MNFERTIDDVVETLRKAKDRNQGCSLLIGSGCSVSAGIPKAAGIIEIIKTRFNRCYQRAEEEKDDETSLYFHCMRQLSPGDRRDLLRELINNAKINWAHIGIAALIKGGYVTRVLTTNFDPIVLRASALLGIFPAVYDIAQSEKFKADAVSDPSVFYLHGQHTGFLLINTQNEFDSMSDRLTPVFSDAGRNRPWMVVGYSGESDPVFNQLTSVQQFNYGLYWIGYKDDIPAQHIREQLLVENKYAFHVSGFDADSFFIKLAQELKCFPPDFVEKPFTHFQFLMKDVKPFTLTLGGADILDGMREMIDQAVQEIENRTMPPDKDESVSPVTPFPTFTPSKARSMLVAGEYDELIKIGKQYAASAPPPGLSDFIYWANYMKAWELYSEALKKTGEESENLFKEAFEKYAEAARIKPDDFHVYASWSSSLVRYSYLKSGDEKESILSEAEEKGQKAEEIKKGSGAYNLACIYALRGNEAKAREYLEIEFEAGEETPLEERVEKDKGLDSMKSTDWFREFLDKLDKQEKK